MRFARTFVLAFLFLLLTLPALPQQTATSTVQRDPQALGILAQALATSGGATLIASLRDFTASGSVTYSWAGSQVQGTATLRALGMSSFRLDTNLPQGMRSWSATSGKGYVKETTGQVNPIPSHNTMHLPALSFPQWKIADILSNAALSVSNSGTSTYGTHQLVVIHVQLPVDDSSDPGGFISHLSATDLLIDAVNFQVVTIRDAFHPTRDSMLDVVHEISFADYRLVHGSLVPFSFTESVDGQQTWSIQLKSSTFNTGLTAADFQL